MNKGKSMKLSLFISSIFILIFAIILTGCEKEADSSIISKGTSTTQKDIEAMNNIDRKSYEEVADVFLDTAKITTQDKPYFLVFGANGCIYCDELKKLIKDNSAIKEYLKNDYSSYYINISYSKNHQIDFLKDPIPTHQLAQNYNIKPTPTLVFLSPSGKVLFIYPGYMPKDRLLTTLEFLKNKNLEDLDEKTIAKNLQQLF